MTVNRTFNIYLRFKSGKKIHFNTQRKFISKILYRNIKKHEYIKYISYCLIYPVNIYTFLQHSTKNKCLKKRNMYILAF